MTTAIRRFWPFILLLSVTPILISSCSNSNDYDVFGSIHGVITDYSSGLPLENASILISPGGLTKQTDASGYFRFENLEAEQYTLTVQKQGYQPNRKTVSAISGEDIQVDIQLTPIPH